MIKLPTEEINQVYRFEKKLFKFNNFSYTNYEELKIINVNLQAYIKNADTESDTQLLLDLSFEIDNEMECLLNLRFYEDKNEEFKEHVKITLAIVQKLIKNFPVAVMPSADTATFFWNKLKGYFSKRN